MKNLMLGILIGSVLTTGLGYTAELYRRDGSVQAPRGSALQYDYYRNRQLFLDIQKQRQLLEQGANLMQPCVR